MNIYLLSVGFCLAGVFMSGVSLCTIKAERAFMEGLGDFYMASQKMETTKILPNFNTPIINNYIPIFRIILAILKFSTSTLTLLEPYNNSYTRSPFHGALTSQF